MIRNFTKLSIFAMLSLSLTGCFDSDESSSVLTVGEKSEEVSVAQEKISIEKEVITNKSDEVSACKPEVKLEGSVITIDKESIYDAQISCNKSLVPSGSSSWANHNFGGYHNFALGTYDNNTRMKTAIKFDFESLLSNKDNIDSAFLILNIERWESKWENSDVTINSHLILYTLYMILFI